MGVKQLMKVIYKSIMLETFGTQKTKSDLSNMTIFIDAMSFIYRVLTARKETETMGHIDMILHYYNLSNENNISFIWIFDPVETPEIKKPEQERRKSKKQRYGTISITPDIVRDSMFLIKNLGMKTILCNDIEAEHYASVLSRLMENSAVLSRDTDVLMYGANLLIPISGYGFRFYNISEILSTYELTYEQFVDACLLLGTDYAAKTKGVGSKTVIPKVVNGNYTLTTEQVKARNHIMRDKDLGCNFTDTILDKSAVLNFLKIKNFATANNHVQKLITTWNIQLEN